MDVVVPGEVLAAYGFDAGAVEPLPGGLINATFVVRGDGGGVVATLQRLHTIFSGEVNLDIDAITAHVAARGLETPRVIRTITGALWWEVDGRAWRVLSWVDGHTVHKVDSPARARAAGQLVGRFHRAVADLDHTFAFARANVHDTAGFVARLGERIARAPGGDDERAAQALGREILDEAAGLPVLGELPRRICHGDLKISNLVFRGDDAVCLIDLDTVGRQTLAYEMGDALRSWCNPAGEDVDQAAISRELYRAALAGYLAEAEPLISDAEIESIRPGLRTVCIELAARFCIDVFDDSYFGWDPARYASRREHNLVRARGQLALGRSVTLP